MKTSAVGDTASHQYAGEELDCNNNPSLFSLYATHWTVDIGSLDIRCHWNNNPQLSHTAGMLLVQLSVWRHTNYEEDIITLSRLPPKNILVDLIRKYENKLSEGWFGRVRAEGHC